MQNQELFTRLETLLGRFLDLEHLMSLCVQVSKSNTNKKKILYKVSINYTVDSVNM